MRVLARGVLAGAATEVALSGALLLLWRAFYGHWLQVTAPLLVFSLGAGLAAGLAWGAAEAAARRVARPWLGAALGLLVGAVLATVAPLAGDYFLHLVDTASSLKALLRLLDSLDPVPSPWLFLSGAVCLYGPALVVRRLGGSFTHEALVMSLGLLAWGLALGVAAALGARVGFGPLNLSLLLVLLLGRALVFPLGLRAADRLCLAFARRARGDEVEPRRRGPTVAPRTPSAAERAKARWHDDRASALQGAEAATERALAFALWPTPERALSLARAHAVRFATEPALAALEDAAALAGARATTFDPDDPAWEALHGHVRFEALASSQLVHRRAFGPGARLLLGAYATTVALAAAAPAIFARSESAELTRLRVAAWATGDGAAWLSLGEDLAAGSPTLRRGFGALEWTPGLLVRCRADFPAPDPDLALGAFLRAAEAGHPTGMVRAAAGLACYPDRQVEAARWCRRSAEAGDPEGMWRWARMVRGGWFGMATDPVSGREWLERAASAGCAEAQVDLARLLARGGERQSARTWFERAIEAGHGTADDELAAFEAAVADATVDAPGGAE